MIGCAAFISRFYFPYLDDTVKILSLRVLTPQERVSSCMPPTKAVTVCSGSKNTYVYVLSPSVYMYPILPVMTWVASDQQGQGWFRHTSSITLIQKVQISVALVWLSLKQTCRTTPRVFSKPISPLSVEAFSSLPLSCVVGGRIIILRFVLESHSR